MRTREIEREARRVIRDAVQQEGWEPYEVMFSDEDSKYEAIYLGTEMGLNPSGKFYTIWACSNVTDKEMDQDCAWFEAANHEAGKYDAWLENGEGDPCDLFLVRAAQ